MRLPHLPYAHPLPPLNTPPLPHASHFNMLQVGAFPAVISAGRQHLKNFKSARSIKMPGNHVQNFSAFRGNSGRLHLHLLFFLPRDRGDSQLASFTCSSLSCSSTHPHTHPTCPLKSLHTLPVCLPMPFLPLRPSPSLFPPLR